jgi:hypothetical protein
MVDLNYPQDSLVLEIVLRFSFFLVGVGELLTRESCADHKGTQDA